MLKYLLISTVIVLAVTMIVAGWTNRDLIRIKIASVYARVPPKAAPPANPIQTGNSVPLRGDAPWALSALPGCLTQLSETSGPPAYVLRHLPAGSVAVAAPNTLAYGNCTIAVVDSQAFVRRGRDLFRIPPVVRFYRSGATLSLLHVGSGGMELRVYEPVGK